MYKRAKFVFFIIVFTGSHLFSGVEDYFKSCPDKQEISRIENIDFIYMINLDERPEKFEKCEKQLHPYGIFPYRFSAVNGWKLSYDALDDLGIRYESWMARNIWGTYYLPENVGMPTHEVMDKPGRSYFCHCMAFGTVGIVLSHLSVLQDAWDSGYDTIWVMEDDIDVIENPHILSEYIKRLDSLVGVNGWDILFTDQDTKDQKGQYVKCLGYAPRPNFTPRNIERFQEQRLISSDFRKIGARYGAYSMIIRRQGMKKILDFIKQYKVFLPYDMEFYLPDDMNLFALTHDVVSTLPNALSDNGSPNYKTSNSI